MKTSSLTFLLLLLTVGAWAQALPKPMSHDELLRRLAERRGTNHLAGTPLIPAGTTLGQPGSGALAPSGTPLPAGPAGPGTVPFSSSTLVSGNGGAGTGSPDETIPPGTINFQGVDVNQVLDVYAQLVNRTLLRAQLPQASIVLKTQTPLTKSEAIAALKAVLALNNIAVIDVGDKFVKVVPVEMAGASAAVIDRSSATNLPELGSYVTHVVQLKYIKPSVMMPIIQPFAKLQNSVLPIDDNQILVLRDFAENVKRMLEMIEQVDVSVPEEYISEVIPIKYAQAEDIAGALNSLGGNGGSSVTSFGSGGNGSSISGLHGPTGGGGFGGGGGGISGLGGSTSGGYGNGSSNFGQNRTLGGATPNGTPSSGSSFQSRLNSIINKAAGGQQDQIQVFGQAKIIADSRSNSLLIFATRADMIHIKHVIDQLDVLLAQVLIEAVIMDVSLDKAFSFGVSAAQNPKSFSPSTPVIGGGGFNNGQPFANFLSSNANYFANGSNVTSSLGNGFSYFGNIGTTWDVAMQALASDTSASVIQRPRIQTSQAKEAQFFVGETVPYITSSYYGGVGYGNNSSYSQLSVGIELDITPFINPDGLVVMDVQQEIDDIVSSTASNGDLAPTTSKRTLNSEIAVKDKDTIILGGFVKSQVSRSRSGVPILEDIPLLGSLFSQKSSNKDREELLVLMRPTVLRSPDQADTETLREERRLPGVSAAASDDAEYERELINAQKKAEKARAKKTGQYDGFYNAESNQVDSVNLPTSTQAVYPPTQPPQQPVPMSNEDQIKAQQALQEKLNILNSADTNSNK